MNITNAAPARRSRRFSWALAIAAGLSSAALVPGTAQARDRDDWRERDRDREWRRERDRREHERERYREHRRHESFEFRIGGRSGPQHCEPQRAWVEPVYRTVCDKVWIEPVYEERCQKVWVEPVYQEVHEKVWVPDRWECRRQVCHERGRRVVREVRVLAERGHWDQVCRKVCVREGHWQEARQRVCVADGHWKTVERQELVTPGHWEEVGPRPVVHERSSINFDLAVLLGR
jgi:hypothetical protein